MPRSKPPQERPLFELLQEERDVLNAFLSKPPKGPKRLAKLEQAIFTITKRVAPLYEQGQGMARRDLELIDLATVLLSDVEDKLEAATERAKRARRNLNLMYTGAGTLHYPDGE